MDRGERYLDKASECLEASRVLSYPEQRASVLVIADAFVRLAEWVHRRKREAAPLLTGSEPKSE